MTTETTPPFWMHELVTAEQYDSWPEDQCSGIEIMDGTCSPASSRRSHRSRWRSTSARSESGLKLRSAP
jgi:hypothetical protein